MARGASNLEDRPTSRRVGALGALWPFVRPYRGQMVLALVALVLTSAISLILPHYWYDPYMAVGKNIVLMVATLWLLGDEPRAREARG